MAASTTTNKASSTVSKKPPSKAAVKQAGVSLQSGGDSNPNPIQHGGMGQAERAFSAASTFLSGIMAISASQFIGAPLKLIDPKFYEAYMAWTKESFAVLMTTITQWWAPTVVRVSGDESMKGQLFLMDDGTLKCNFPHRLILMGNHQLYTDWLYLWWIAYTNKMHGRIYIILKESLKSVPIIGWGMQFYNFIFLSRKWEQDRYMFKKHLDHLKNPKDPMWLLIFPEGTNLSAVTREKSAKWSEKTGIPDMKHQLLPRSTGLQFCLKEMRGSTNWLYDCTIAYEGVPKGMYGQDIFTLKSSFFEGRPPKSVNMFWRRFKISEIPYQDEDQFSRWLLNRWREKDYILEYYYKFGSFPDEQPTQALLAVEGKKKPNHAKSISTSVKGGGWDEFLSIFGPITTAAGALSNVDMTEPFNFDEMMMKVAKSQQFNLLTMGQSPFGAASQQTIKKALLAANKSNPLPTSVINQLLKTMPATQGQMKQALQKSGNPEVAKKAAKAPGSDKAMPTDQKKELAKAGGQAVKMVSDLQKDSPANATPVDRVKREIPLANLESMITRPISTMAIHTVGKGVKDLAAARAGKKPPAKQPPPKKPTPLTAKNLRNVPQKPITIARTSPPPSVRPKATSIKSAPVGGVKKLGGTVLSSPPAKRPPAKNSKPLGTQKYVNGRPV
ncbi:hypothetical protein PRZ48_010305 [Zasmidium cellare]|uniref:Phospholipid/glycerol acyltransferase domain-containing protein n=1 Tax=Zasmidium cellare TaxID=395010 RepID=A0ABR0E892_ZASCE|nr:hypothetical protein PRZ48_010305 [Zasmidium cellare]